MVPFLQREAQEREEAEQVRQERIKKEQEEEREVSFVWFQQPSLYDKCKG